MRSKAEAQEYRTLPGVEFGLYDRRHDKEARFLELGITCSRDWVGLNEAEA